MTEDEDADDSGLAPEAIEEEQQPAEDEQAAATVPPVVGIGASAGGIDALLRLLPAIQPECGLVFVIVQHLDPARESALTAVLARVSPIPVTEIHDNTPVEPNHVYVIPPNAALTIEAGRLRLGVVVPSLARYGAIDGFFRSLAQDQGENAACVILSGTGSDGTLGLRAIKGVGGLTVAQADATYDGMMRSAVATGMVDFVLPVEDIPVKLQEYFSFAGQLRGPKPPDVVTDLAPHSMAAILSLLRNHTGHDFSGYKDRTIIRRVHRRMHVLQVTELAQYLGRLREDPGELTLLLQDLLIGVTDFFRDRDAFEALKQSVIPELFKDKGPEDTIRVWVPGCSSGEEAYSIAILLREHATTLVSPPKLQVFASDIDERALAIARSGRYPATIAKDLPEDLLKRYFVREDGTYLISAGLREICLFSLHNLLRDAPFSRQDLISCRNLLIYLTGDLQSHVIQLFHYALNANGFLFLGSSENVANHLRLFSVVSKVHRIFQRRAGIERVIPKFPLSTPDVARGATLSRSQRLLAEPTVREMAERQLLERFLPPYVVINADGEVLQSSGRTGKYLELPAGAPDTNLFSMARPGLRLELRATLQKAITGRQTALQPNVSVGTDGGRQEIDLYVQPLRFGTPPETFFMVIFRDIGALRPDATEDLAEPDQDAVRTSVRNLEHELRATRERLQSTTEELETSNEELRSTNEEISSINEELQSANEELETSKEELQSINEELHTVNAELNSRVDDLTRANNDMSNLLDSTQIATIFLDRMLQVKGFTPAAKDVFRLVESDTGRPIMHVRPRVEVGDLQDDAERVLRTLATIERPVNSSENDTLYMMRLLPYRTMDNLISGVVMTFIDVTQISHAQARIQELAGDLRARIEELETVIGLVPVGIMIAEGAGPDRILINEWGARLLGYAEQHKSLVPVADFRIHDGERELPEAEMPLQRALRTGETIQMTEGQVKRADGSTVDVMMSATPLFDKNNVVRGAIAALVDISARKGSESRQRVLLNELQHRVKNTLATITSLATRMGRRTQSPAEFQQAFLSRLTAMGRTHDLLSRGAWEGASLRSLLEVALNSYANMDRSNVMLHGPQVMLTPNTSSTLGMVFHELTTNASKYGALSTEGGVVEVSWQIREGADGEPRLHVAWEERNGPPVVPTLVEGFGTGFARRSLEYEMEGRADLQLLPGGVRCDLEFPLAGNLE